MQMQCHWHWQSLWKVNGARHHPQKPPIAISDASPDEKDARGYRPAGGAAAGTSTLVSIPEARPWARYTSCVAFTKSDGLASGMFRKVCGLRSVSGNQEL